ncbi:MAG: DUF4080 domain-containing protein [Dysgonamonadaceae bacterium]|nr:DUF4080 domain-containing protein [Dysgonamonadaceae bacterium]MDD4729348.1 DUF4080 domain-containing protein [Dysgonamonadaceae bacterium]
MSKFLLTTLNAKYIHLNLAIRILYDLNHNKANIDWIEHTINSDFNEVAETCASYDVVCFSCYIWNISQTLKVCEILKKINPHVKILLGGPEVSYEWEKVIAYPDVDYLILGEGEIPFHQFVTNYPQVKGIPNLVTKENQSKLLPTPIDCNFNVTNLTNRNPYQYDDPKELRNKVCYIETSRGCPYKCEYCLASLDNNVRNLPVDTVKSNLLYLMEHGRIIKFLDRTFNLKKDFTIDLFQFILDNHQPDNVFQFEITADIFHRDIITFVQEKVPSGLFRFEIGIQTVNQESNREVGRKQDFAKTSDIVNQLKNKIEMHLDLIVGLPFEYFINLKHSFDETFALYPEELQLGFLKFLKGTPLRINHEKHGYKFDENAPYEIIESQFINQEELHKATLIEKALDIYWNKKRAINTLRYISSKESIFDFLLGLGEYFDTNYHFHKHILSDIYEALYKYAKTSHASDKVLLQLIYLDYYNYNKIKPYDLFGIEPDRKEQNRTLINLGLNIHQFRYVYFPVSFNVSHWLDNYEIINDNDLLIIQFTGRDNPIALSGNRIKDRSN